MPVARGSTAPPLPAARRRLPDVLPSRRFRRPCRATGCRTSFALPTDRPRWRPQALDVVNTRRSGAGEPVPACTSPCGSGWPAGKRRPGADDRVSAGSASHRARRDGLSTHAGRLPEARSTGDGSNHCDRGSRAAVCGDRRSFFYPVFAALLVRATGHRRCLDDRTTTVHAARNGTVPRPADHPRGLRPGRTVHGSLPNRPDATSSALAPTPAQGAGQRRAQPAAQGFRRTSVRRERAGQAESCGTETCRARAAPVMRWQRLAGQGARTVRKIFPARIARRHGRLPRGFARPPTRNVSSPLHAAPRARAGRFRRCCGVAAALLRRCCGVA